MADYEVQFFYTDTKPTANIVPHALYFVKEPSATEAQIFKGNAAGDGLVPFSEKLTGQNALTLFSATQPSGTTKPYHRFWYNTTEEKLYVNKTDYNPTSSDWESEAVWGPSVVLPEGLQLGAAGGAAGVADTAARSDHYHTGVVVESAEF